MQYDVKSIRLDEQADSQSSNHRRLSFANTSTFCRYELGYLGIFQSTFSYASGYTLVLDSCQKSYATGFPQNKNTPLISRTLGIFATSNVSGLHAKVTSRYSHKCALSAVCRCRTFWPMLH